MATLNRQVEAVGGISTIQTLVRQNLAKLEAQESGLYIIVPATARQETDEDEVAQRNTLLLDWLTTHDSEELHQKARETHQGGTGEWILEEPTFLEWKISSNGCLWLHGIPGAGKTLLTSVIVDSLLRNVTEGVAYHYCTYRSAISQHGCHVLGSLCRQLIMQKLECFEDLEELYKRYRAAGKEPIPPRVRDLGDLLWTLSSRFSKNVFVAVDGLDECGAAAEIDRSELVDVLAQLQMHKSRPASAQQSPTPSFRLLVASRKEADIALAFRGQFDSIPIAARPADLRLYVGAEVAKRRRLQTFATPAVRELIMERLVDRADGM
jgi:hypothetical protein